jgi:MFS family permease
MEAAGPDGRACSRAGWFTLEAVVLGAAFLLAFGYGGVFQTLLPLRSGLLLGFDAGDIALLVTAGYVADLLLLIPVGWLSDRKGKHRILAGGLGSLLLGTLLFGSGRGPFSMHLSSILLGASLSTWMMPAAIVVTRRGRRARSKALGLYRFVVDIGYILGPVMLGFIVEHQGYRVAGMVFAGLVASILLLILLWNAPTSENAG